LNNEILYKQVVALIFLGAFFAQTFSKTIIVTGYYANTKAYAKNCENKSKPHMHCNGKCQMIKKLKQEENNDKQNPDRKADNKNEVLSSRSYFPSIDAIVMQCDNEYPAFENSVIIHRTLNIFHPPQGCCSYSNNI
jgi:hypothetical protein